MYFIEVLIKKFMKKPQKQKILTSFEPEPQELEDPVTCEHVFLPIDSTKQILACSKCGFVINKSETKTKPKNPFN